MPINRLNLFIDSVIWFHNRLRIDKSSQQNVMANISTEAGNIVRTNNILISGYIKYNMNTD